MTVTLTHKEAQCFTCIPITTCRYSAALTCGRLISNKTITYYHTGLTGSPMHAHYFRYASLLT